MKNEIKNKYKTLEECNNLNSEDNLNKYQVEHVINPRARVAMTQICRGFSIANEPSWRDAELCLFDGDDAEPVIRAFLDWEKEQFLQAPRKRVHCILDINGALPRQHISAYLDLAGRYPDILFLLETVHPEVFIDIYPSGSCFPINVFLGTSITTESNWERQLEKLNKCCTVSRYVRIIDPVIEYDLSDWAWEPDTGEGICWVVADVNPERKIFDESAKLLSMLCDQCEHLGVPFWTEGGDFQTSPAFTKLEDIDTVAGKQLPEPPELRLGDLGFEVPLQMANLTVREFIRLQEMSNPMRGIYEIVCHAKNESEKK